MKTGAAESWRVATLGENSLAVIQPLVCVHTARGQRSCQMIFTSRSQGQRQGVVNGAQPDLRLNINAPPLPLGGAHIYIKNHIHSAFSSRREREQSHRYILSQPWTQAVHCHSERSYFTGRDYTASTMPKKNVCFVIVLVLNGSVKWLLHFQSSVCIQTAL